MQLNAKKTKTMSVSRNEERITLRADEKDLEQVKEYACMFTWERQLQKMSPRRKRLLEELGWQKQSFMETKSSSGEPSLSVSKRSS